MEAAIAGKSEFTDTPSSIHSFDSAREHPMY